MNTIDFEKFRNLKFEDFKRLAKDDALSQYEKIGFPDVYREGKEDRIFSDIICKLGNLHKQKQLVIDIGPGCSGLAHMMIELCRRNEHHLCLIDSEEMLAYLPDAPFLTKIPARYPQQCKWLFAEYRGKVNTILAYSVLHYIFAEASVFEFLDLSLSLLADGGEMLVGDIPNVSKRKRFFSSPHGIEFHQQFTNTDEIPSVVFNTQEIGQIDDAVINSLLMHSRASGFDAYWLPQSEDLPMANRREDILIRKP